MEKKLAHVGIAVRNLDAASELFSKLLKSPEAGRETVLDQNVKIAFFHTEGASIELTAPTTAESPLGKFLEKRGEGVHHLSFEVDDIRSELKRLKGEGFQLIDEEPRIGAGGYWIAFLHPKSTNGVLIEISQKRK